MKIMISNAENIFKNRNYVRKNCFRLNAKEKKEKTTRRAPILTNTTLSVLRQMGKYCQMSRLLSPVAFEITTSMTQFFDFYLFTVHSFFASDLVCPL